MLCGLIFLDTFATRATLVRVPASVRVLTASVVAGEPVLPVLYRASLPLPAVFLPAAIFLPLVRVVSNPPRVAPVADAVLFPVAPASGGLLSPPVLLVDFLSSMSFLVPTGSMRQSRAGTRVCQSVVLFS